MDDRNACSYVTCKRTKNETKLGFVFKTENGKLKNQPIDTQLFLLQFAFLLINPTD